MAYATATGKRALRYFARSKFSRSFDHKKSFSLIWQVVLNLVYLFAVGGKIPFLSLNEPGEMLHGTVILGKSVNKPKSNSYWFIVSRKFFHWLKFKARSYDIFFSKTFDLLLIDSSRYLLFGVYFSLVPSSLRQINIVCKYKNRSWNKNKGIYIFMSLKNPICFNVELKFLINNIWFFSVSSTHF